MREPGRRGHRHDAVVRERRDARRRGAVNTVACMCARNTQAMRRACHCRRMIAHRSATATKGGPRTNSKLPLAVQPPAKHRPRGRDNERMCAPASDVDNSVTCATRRAVNRHNSQP